MKYTHRSRRTEEFFKFMRNALELPSPLESCSHKPRVCVCVRDDSGGHRSVNWLWHTHFASGHMDSRGLVSILVGLSSRVEPGKACPFGCLAPGFWRLWWWWWWLLIIIIVNTRIGFNKLRSYSNYQTDLIIFTQSTPFRCISCHWNQSLFNGNQLETNGKYVSGVYVAIMIWIGEPVC